MEVRLSASCRDLWCLSGTGGSHALQCPCSLAVFPFFLYWAPNRLPIAGSTWFFWSPTLSQGWENAFCTPQGNRNMVHCKLLSKQT